MQRNVSWTDELTDNENRFSAPMVCLPFGRVYFKDVVNFLCNGRVLLGSVSEFFQKAYF